MRFLPPILMLLMSISPVQAKLFVDYVDYEDYVYSNSKKTELGDQIQLEMALKYQYNSDTYARLRFQTRPEDNREDNKTDKFELALGHQLEDLSLVLDLELLTNDGTSGGTALSFDLDSDSTYIKWQESESLSLSFYPFNFDGEVGGEFGTWDVTRLYFIEGTLPGGTINGTQGSQKIVDKTIPGLVVDYKWDSMEFSLGLGVASYIYPVDAGFDIADSSSVTRLERKEDFGYKFSFNYQEPDILTKFEFVGHSAADETGALLESAASFFTLARLNSLLMELEVTHSKAGKRAWDVNRSSGWFSQTSPYLPVYSNYLGTAEQNWLGKSDTAYSLRVGYQLDKSTPYLFYRHQGEHFIFNGGESAHELRTYDLNLSHGGLSRYGLGSFFYYGKNLTINPELEFRSARNAVFANSSDVRDDRYLASFKKNDFLITLFVNYQFDGNREFKL